MPIIPKAQTGSQLRTGGASISQAAAGSVGQAVSSLGGVAAGIGFEAIERKKQADDAAFVTEQTNKILREETEKQAGIETRGDDVNFDDIDSEYQERLSSALENAPSEDAANEVRRQADTFYSRKFYPRYSQHQSKLNVNKRVNATENALDDINSEVLTGRTSVSEALARSEAAITGLAETAGGVVDIDELRNNQKSSIGVSHLTSRIDAGQGSQVIDEIEDGKWDEFTTTDELAAIQRQAIKQVNEAQAAAQKEADKRNAIIASDLEISVFRDDASYRDIDNALKANIISPSKRTQLYKQLDSNAKKSNDEADNFTRVQTSISMGIPLDPTSKDDKAGVDALWESMIPDINAKDPDDFANSAVSFVQATGILPKSLKGSIAAFARSGNTDQAAMASDLIGRLQAVSSPALNDLTKESYAFGLSVSSQVAAGVDKNKAVEIARNSAFGQNEQTKKVTNATIKAASDGNVTFLNDRLDEFDPGVFSFQPEITPAMQAEFEVLLGEMLPFTNNDIDSARSMAWTSMKNVWGATTVNGDIQVMKYAPEAMYGGKDTEWIKEQFDSDMLSREELLADTGTVTSEGRPVFVNQFGDFVTERTATVKIGDGFINVPTVFKGKFLSEDQAAEKVVNSGLKDPITGRKLDVFDTIEEAVAAAEDRSGSMVIPDEARRASKPVPEKINAFIGVDIKTARSGQPSYPVFTRNESGIVAPLLDENNLPLRWKPEFSSSPAYKELEAEQNSRIRKAKDRRLIIDQKVEQRQRRLERVSRDQQSFKENTQGE